MRVINQVLRWLEPKILKAWYRPPSHSPSKIFTALHQRLEQAYLQQGYREKPKRDVPPFIIVVGNLTVGGSGKTPLVMALVQYLQKQGVRVGIVSRGYGRKGSSLVRVAPHTSVEVSGDEPLLMAQRLNVPVYVSCDRVQAIDSMVQEEKVTVVVCDDGLQNKKLPRHLEILAVDGSRGFGNHCLLPFGPLRMPLSQLSRFDWVVCKDRIPSGYDLEGRAHIATWQDEGLVRLEDAQTRPAPSVSIKKSTALAGIADPIPFFERVRALGWDLEETLCFPDHYAYQARNLASLKGKHVIMTEKDAVKCRSFAAGEDWWFLKASYHLPENFWNAFEASVRPAKASPPIAGME